MQEVTQLSLISRSHGLRVAVAESLTSGLLADEIGAGEGASDWFAGGIVAYMTDVKERVLGLAPGTDPCSPECAEQLAAGARELFEADVCVSTTGVGGPDPDGGHAPGTVYLGWASRDGVGHRRLDLGGDPAQVLEGAIAAAMRLLTARAEEISARNTPRKEDDHAPWRELATEGP